MIAGLLLAILAGEVWIIALLYTIRWNAAATTATVRVMAAMIGKGK